MTTPAIPLRDQLDCVERELGFRRRVYPGLVERGRMTQEAADRELDRMYAVRDTIQRLVQAEPIMGVRRDG